MIVLPNGQNTKSIIFITHFDGKRVEVPAVVVSPRIAVHNRTNKAGVDKDRWHVSDPVSGYAWATCFYSEASAVAWAKRLRRRFGPNPLKGAIINPGGGWKRRGVHHAAIVKFLQREYENAAASAS